MSEQPFQLVSATEARGILNLGKTSFFRLKATDKNFPKAVTLGKKQGYILRDLEAFIERRKR
jgi:predicted DNA-binding transcriptional regulator AlpA